jgi:hypothetical protein
MSELSQTKERPIGVTILAILAGIAAVLAAIHALQFLGILPFFIGSSGYKVHAFSFWYALMYGLLFWVYIWLTMMLWRVERQAWLFLVMITMFYLILDFFSLFGATSWNDVAVSVILNAIILLYCMLPGVRSAFGALPHQYLPLSIPFHLALPGYCWRCR